jgi:hypothetical protein
VGVICQYLGDAFTLHRLHFCGTLYDLAPLVREIPNIGECYPVKGIGEDRIH